MALGKSLIHQSFNVLICKMLKILVLKISTYANDIDVFFQDRKSLLNSMQFPVCDTKEIYNLYHQFTNQ